MTTTKTIELHYMKSCRLHAPLSPSIWSIPGAPIPGNYTIIPHDMTQLRNMGMDVHANKLEAYKRFDYEAEFPDGSNCEVHKFNFQFEYAIRDGDFTVQNRRPYGRPEKVPLRVRFWRMIAGPPIDSFYYDISLTSRNEYNFGCVILKQLNEGLSELHRGRSILRPDGTSMIPKSCLLRRSPTIRDSPANYGNPLVLFEGETTEMDYDRIYEYYYGMYGSQEYGQRERDDQDAVANFPMDEEEGKGIFSRPATPEF